MRANLSSMGNEESSWDDYWRPSVAADVALLTVVREGRGKRLAVLLHRAAGGHTAGRWSLPGTFLREGERLVDAALRALRDKAGVAGERPHQLRVFDDPGRDDRGRVLSVAHVDLVSEHRLPLREDVVLAPVDAEMRVELPGRQRRLPYDHDRIVRHAVRWARGVYRAGADPSHLLGETFTLYELRRVHEAVMGHELQKDSFRRAMRHHVVGLGVLDERGSTVGKPAELFRRATREEVKASQERSSMR
jgi:8-oxo-dGTP diphosphatase